MSVDCWSLFVVACCWLFRVRLMCVCMLCVRLLFDVCRAFDVVRMLLVVACLQFLATCCSLCVVCCCVLSVVC